jgi:hypothetical protein
MPNYFSLNRKRPTNLMTSISANLGWPSRCLSESFIGE